MERKLISFEGLYGIIKDRQEKRPEGSYAASLFKRGIRRIAQKVGEEGTETALAGLELGLTGEGREELIEETADLWFHSLVLLAASGIQPSEVFAELTRRHAEKEGKKVNMNEFETRLKIAIQKGDGRMGQDSLALLTAANFISRKTNRVDICDVDGFPLSIEFTRIGDIPNDVERGYVDFGIVGQNSIAESRANLVPLIALGFGKCSLQLGVRKEIPYTTPADLGGLTVATSYPNLSTDFFNQRGVRVDLLVRSGSIEKYVESGKAQACIDLTSSGTTMEANGMMRYDILLESEAMLVASPKLGQKRGSERLVREFLMSVISALRIRDFTYIVMNVPESARQTVINFLPSGESPTMSPLNENGWWAISSLIPRCDFRKIISDLQEVGAKDILEFTPKQIIPNRNDRVIIELMQKIYGKY